MKGAIFAEKNSAISARCTDIVCHGYDLSARHQFHNGKRQKKDDRWIDRDLFSGIESQSFKRSCRAFPEEKPDAVPAIKRRPKKQRRAATSRADESGGALMVPQGAFSEDELLQIEREHPDGVSSEEIVGFFTQRGIRFTEATLRKYVQLGLLPRSRRVALKGNQRGSVGRYPTAIVRRIQSLKSLLSTHSMEEIQSEFLFVRTDVEELERTLEKIFFSLSAAAKSPRLGDGSPRLVTRELSDARALAAELVAKVTSVETRLTMQARLHREAV
jgi:hypothetical protein